jgi:hypothetical protein
LQGSPFRSQRFSRHGETFAYVKYVGVERESESRLSERIALEDALNRALVPGALGCVIGGGLGLHYGYVDLALCDLDHAPELMRRVLSAVHLRGPAWLLFCDSPWQQEWLALSKGAGVPPGLAA